MRKNVHQPWPLALFRGSIIHISVVVRRLALVPLRRAVPLSVALLVATVLLCSMLLVLLRISALWILVCSVVCVLLRLLLCNVALHLLWVQRLLLCLRLLCRVLWLCVRAGGCRWLPLLRFALRLVVGGCLLALL